MTQLFDGQDRPISRIGLGLGLGGQFRSRKDSGNFAEALEEAVRIGVNHIDTAQGYGGGESEKLISKILRDDLNSIMVATKIGPENFGSGRVTSAIEDSLRRLGIDTIPLLYLHWPDPSIPLEVTLSQLESAFKAGKIRGVGLSNFPLSAVQLAHARLGSRILRAVQFEYNLFDRTAEVDYLPSTEALGLAAVAYSPLDQGGVVGNRTVRERLLEIAEAEKVTLAQLALRWLLDNSRCFLIPSSRSAQRVRENFESQEAEISNRANEEIDAITRPRLVKIAPREVRVGPSLASGNSFREDLRNAINNGEGFTPSPLALAKSLEEGEKLKPIRVYSPEKPGDMFELAEGRVRFWAHVIAFGESALIEAQIRDYNLG